MPEQHNEKPRQSPGRGGRGEVCQAYRIAKPGADRYSLDSDAPNNTRIRHYGVWDAQEDEYATLPDGTFCYGMLLDEAKSALAELRAHSSEQPPPESEPRASDEPGGRAEHSEPGMTLPFVAVGAGERAPWADEPLTCPECGAGPLELGDSEPPGLTFISHCGKSWLRGQPDFERMRKARRAENSPHEA